ncbi:MarR family winged helix-turn-helix transcriptional regulator [bacterium]|nr:MarR family winged helix-turn-helix transcriptional regulator [bacterium]
MSLQSANKTAIKLLDTIPLIMRRVRHDMRGRRPDEISVPQFRVMVYLDLHDGAMLSDVSAHIGLSRPTMSKMINGLVRRRWVRRRVPADNRRRVQLGLTEAGQAAMRAARDATRRNLAGALGHLSQDEHRTLAEAMNLLGRVFAQDSDGTNGRNSDSLR